MKTTLRKLFLVTSIAIISINTQAEITPNNNAPVPKNKCVYLSQEILDFEIEHFKDTFLISWTINPVEEIGYYELFVSRDGIQWESIKRMKALPIDSEEQTLSHIHKAGRKDKNLYFKLSACDLEGNTSVLASAKSKGKPHYIQALTSIPKLLISTTLLVFSRTIHFDNSK